MLWCPLEKLDLRTWLSQSQIYVVGNHGVHAYAETTQNGARESRGCLIVEEVEGWDGVRLRAL